MKSSRERAENYLTVDRISKYKDKDIESLVKILDQHAAEARAEQREACAKKAVSKIQSPLMQKVVSDACLNAVEKLKDQVKKSPHDEG